MDRWRYKEIWLLDYVRKYGNSCIKENAPKQVKRNENTIKPKPTYQSKPSKLSYAEITSKSQDAPEVLENNAQTSLFPSQIADPNNRRNTKNNQHHGRKSPFERNSNANPYQSKIIAATMPQYCGNIAATHFCYQKPDFETSEMLPLAATTSGNILAILLECCR